MSEMKKCSVCKTYQALDRFPGKAKQSICVECKSRERREANATMRKAVLSMLGGVCACCGETADVFLDIDHVHNDGARDRRRRRRATWRAALQNPERFQVLCRNCNWAKFLGGCPHEEVRRG